MEIDPQFRQGQQAAKRRKARRLSRQIGLIALGTTGLIAVALLISWIVNRPGDQAAVIAEAEDAQIVPVESSETGSAARLATPFADIAGDPMILRFADAELSDQKHLVGPATLDEVRFGPPKPARLTLVRENLVARQQRLMTALPSSREDFAFFQAQRSLSLEAANVQVGAPLGAGAEVTVVGDDNSWGSQLGGESGDVSTRYVDTRVQNTTSVAFVTADNQRKSLFSEFASRLVQPTPLATFLTTNGFGKGLSADIEAQAVTLFPRMSEVAEEGGLPVNTVIAVRQRVINDDPVPLQVTIFAPDGYVGTLARRGTAGYALGNNPWSQDDLTALSRPETDAPVAEQQDYRLLDAVYSAAIRAGVPTKQLGELIAMMSQAYDLEAVAAAGDTFELLYAPENGTGAAQIAFAAISGPSGQMPCYVAQLPDDEEFVCYDQRGAVGKSGGAGFVTPVNGTLSSPFGPRFHPILKQVRLHGGVDWAAPTGTPIVAAKDGTFAVVGNGGGYGKVIYIDHADGIQSRYAHMDRFHPRAVVGAQVRAGELIGYVGTTGRSTGPHLHFEIRRNGAPINPFTLGQGGTVSSSSAVDALTDQIIKVESAGVATAKNPLSTATGLGQFIESTWLRMMRDYRPDLSAKMSRRDLLNLRFDPTLSREMVQNLARENENFLRSRGHRVDAGRLYLSHFLGPAGAHRVLSSPDNATVRAVMGAGVVNANPFLRNYSIADLKAWAQRKMRGAGSGATAPAAAAPVMTREVRAYIAAIDDVLEEFD